MPYPYAPATPPESSGLEPRTRRRRALLLLLCAVGGILLAAATWITTTGLLARSELLAAQRSLDTLKQHPTTARTAGSADPNRPLRSAAAHTAKAHRLTTGPAWYTAAHVPVLGAPLRTIRGTAEASDQLTRGVLPPLVRTAAQFATGTADRGHPDLTALRRAAPALDDAARTAAAVGVQADRLPRSTWLPAADTARTRLATALRRVNSATTDAADAAHLLPAMLGADHPRRYLVIFQNTAEARGTGGLPGAYAVLTADHGRLAFETFGNDTTVADAHTDLELDPGYRDTHAQNAPTSTWVNANLGPHYPDAARIFAGMWRQHSGHRVDGVIALDPHALGALLSAAGPARLPDGTDLTASNAVELTERTAYAAYPDIAERKAFFLDAARAASAQLLTATGDSHRLPALLTALRGQLQQARVKIWSAHRAEQQRLLHRPLAGTLPSGQAAGLIVNNAAGSKLDYYLDRTVTWTPGACTGTGRDVTVDIAMGNRTPATPLPSYVTFRADHPRYVTRPGDNRLLVSYYGPARATLTDATLDGRRVGVAQTSERGHPVYTADVELPARATRTLTLHLYEPHPTPPTLRQPLVRPLRIVTHPAPACER